MTKERMLQILEKNRHLIESKNFKEFYDNLYTLDRHFFTDLFLKSGINPLEYMKRVPSGYASELRNLKNIKIPNNVTSIGYSAFYDCSNLTDIIISSNVTHIGGSAFAHCKNLKNIYYQGSQEDWNKIEISEGNELINTMIHYNHKI